MSVSAGVPANAGILAGTFAHNGRLPMMSMELEVTNKGATYCADCDRCGMTLFTHEWAHMDHNERRDAMQAGTLCCDECSGTADPDTFQSCGRQYAARYTMPGYLDCTEWVYGTNRRELIREIRNMYGD